MSNTKFTPGPWFIREYSGINKENCFVGEILSGETTIYAGPMSFDSLRGQTNEQAFANARLIAAAPEMYVLLKWISGMAADLFPGQKKEEIIAVLKKIEG